MKAVICTGIRKDISNVANADAGIADNNDVIATPTGLELVRLLNGGANSAREVFGSIPRRRADREIASSVHENVKSNLDHPQQSTKNIAVNTVETDVLASQKQRAISLIPIFKRFSNINEADARTAKHRFA